jgi:multicomponent Na+:H+ antiporter subunit D
MIFSDYWMLWPIVVPLAAAFVLQVLDYFVPERMEGWIRISAVVTAAAALGASFSGWNAVRVLHVGGWAAELGIILVTDRLSSVFLLVSSLGGAASAWTVFFPFRRENRRFCGLFFILWGALNGILVTGDLFNMYVFFEILAVSAYVLAGAAMTREGLEAGLKYLVLGTVGALFLLMGTALLYMGSGTLNLALLSSAMESVPRGAAAAAAACLLTGLGLKMGMFPFHFWLPDAHSSASTGVSMILSGVVVKASFYALLRIVFLLFPAGSGFFSVPDILLALGRYDAAISDLSAGLKIDPQSAGLYSARGQAYQFMKKDELAVADLSRAIELETEWFLILFVAPLLYDDGRHFSRENLWKMREPIFGNAIILVLLTTILGGYFIHWLMPYMPLAAAFALAAVLSPTDPVANG